MLLIVCPVTICIQLALLRYQTASVGLIYYLHFPSKTTQNSLFLPRELPYFVDIWHHKELTSSVKRWSDSNPKMHYQQITPSMFNLAVHPNSNKVLQHFQPSLSVCNSYFTSLLQPFCWGFHSCFHFLFGVAAWCSFFVSTFCFSSQAVLLLLQLPPCLWEFTDQRTHSDF